MQCTRVTFLSTSEARLYYELVYVCTIPSLISWDIILGGIVHQLPLDGVMVSLQVTNTVKASTTEY